MTIKIKNKIREKQPYRSIDRLKEFAQEIEEDIITEEVLKNKKSQSQVAREAQRTRERIRQIVEKTKKRLKIR